MADLPRRIQNTWTWQGLIQIAGLVFGLGGLYAGYQAMRDKLPAIEADVKTATQAVHANTSRIANLETRATYTDQRYTEILTELRDINRKLDAKADKP